MTLTKIISGGQTGVDIAALRAAKAVGLETGGTMPKGFRTLAGPKPEYRDLYGMEECEFSDWSSRTRINVVDSHFTLLLGTNLNSPGSQIAIKQAEEFGVPHLTVGCRWYGFHKNDLLQWSITPDTLVKLIPRTVEVLNIGGNRDAALEAPVEAWLVTALQCILDRQESK